MPSKTANLCRFTTSTVGAGAIAVGAAVLGFFTPVQAGIVNGNLVSYSIKDGINSECGEGVYSSTGPTLTRATIYLSSAGTGTPISLSGAAQVILTPLAENVTLSGALTVNKISKSSSAAGLVDSLISDNGTTVTVNGPLTVPASVTGKNLILTDTVPSGNVITIKNTGAGDNTNNRIALAPYTGTNQAAINFIGNSLSNFASAISFEVSPSGSTVEIMRLDGLSGNTTLTGSLRAGTGSTRSIKIDGGATFGTVKVGSGGRLALFPSDDGSTSVFAIAGDSLESLIYAADPTVVSYKVMALDAASYGFRISGSTKGTVDSSGNLNWTGGSLGVGASSSGFRIDSVGYFDNSATPIGGADIATARINNNGAAALNQRAGIGFSIGGIGSAFVGGFYETFNASSDIGVGIMFATQATASGGVLERARIGRSGGFQIGAPTGGDKGADTLNVKGAIYDNGMAPTGTAGSGYVRKTSPTLITPDLGTPSAIVLTNATGIAAGLTAGHVTTNANLTGPITSVGNATTVTVGSITNAMLAGSITSAKLAGLVQADIAGLTTGSNPTFAGLDVAKTVTTANSTAAAITSTLTYNPTANSTSGLPIAAYALAQSAGTHNIFQLTGLYTYFNHDSTGTLGGGVGLFIDSNQKGGSAGVITTNYGLYVGNQTVGTTNFAIYTGSGRIHFGDGATIGNPTGGYEGIGTLNLEGSLYNNGAPPTGTGGYVRGTSPTLTTPTINTPTMQASTLLAPTTVDAYVGNITVNTGFQKGLVIKGDWGGTGVVMAPTSAPQIWLSDYSLNYLNYALQLGYYNASGRGWTGLIQAIAGASNLGADIDINPIGGNVTINRFVNSLGSPVSSLGIGVYPIYPIDVRVPGTNNWIIQAGAGGPVFIRMGIDSSGSPNKGIIEIHTDPLVGSSSGALLLQRTGGNVGIGVSGDPGAMLDVNGSMRAIYFKSAPTTYAGRPGSPTEGDFCNFSDSNTAVWRGVIAGGGGNKVLGRYDGADWTVVG